MRRRRRSKPVSKSEAIAMLVIGLLLGTLFIFGELYWHAPVQRQELRYVDAVYVRYQYHDTRHQSMTVSFEDGEVYDIAVECVNDELLQQLDAIAPGTVLHLGLHPNSSTILEITDHGRTVMPFAHAAKRVKFRARGFLLLGLFLYAAAGYGLYLLVKQKAR